ncbi:MAG: hypothetical protein QOD59_3137 [Mycobacterium sp.]|nr:hypothetical protein [Mycobacterium sp.]
MDLDAPSRATEDHRPGVGVCDQLVDIGLRQDDTGVLLDGDRQLAGAVGLASASSFVGCRRVLIRVPVGAAPTTRRARWWNTDTPPKAGILRTLVAG